MNRSRIEWCDYSWNPITGCLQGCEYCYARRMSVRFSGDVRRNLKSTQCVKEGDVYVLDKKFVADSGGKLAYPFGFSPTLHKYRFDYLDKLKNGQNIFIGAMADVFGKWVPDNWIEEIFKACGDAPQHNYLFLTKNPIRYLFLEKYNGLGYGNNMWLGTSITDNSRQTCDYADIMTSIKNKGVNTFLSIEPLHDNVASIITFNVCADWVVIGAETGNRKDKVIPKKEWIESIVEKCDEAKIPVFMKDSLIDSIGEENMRREFPKQLLRKEVSKKVKARLESDCCKCGTHMDKNQMIALSARSKRGEMPKQLGHICHSCFKWFCNDMNLKIPQLENLKTMGDEREDG